MRSCAVAAASSGPAPRSTRKGLNGSTSPKDSELLALTKRCHPQSLRQMRWANVMLKVLAPQVLAS
jgi:hypothetical protein